MPRPLHLARLLAALLLGIAGWGEVATLPDDAGFGPTPALPAPRPGLLPTVNIAPATGWPAGLAVDPAGALLVADNVGNIVWRVTPAAAQH